MSRLLNRLRRCNTHHNLLKILKWNNRTHSHHSISQCSVWLLAPITAISGFTLGSTFYHNNTHILAESDDKNKHKNRRTARRREREQYNERLCLAVKKNDIAAVEELLSSSLSNPDARSKYGWCALHIAVVNNNLSMAELLLSHGADVHIEDLTNPYVGSIRKDLFCDKIHQNAPTQGWTALHYAVAFFNTAMIELLVGSHGADAYTHYDKRGYSASDYLDESMPQSNQILDLLDEQSNKYSAMKERLDRELRIQYPIEAELKEYIVGQLLPINSVSSAIRRKLNGWYDPEHSNLVFLFLGSSGVGKTELAKCLSKILTKTDTLHGDDSPFIRVDMSEFQHKHEVAKFIGSPPGYVGHEAGGQLTKKLKKHPNAIVLLDEVEKAHPDVLTICLQLFDEGRITDGKGETVECKDAIFIMTSNLAQTEIGDEAEKLRKLNKEEEVEEQSLSRHFIEETIEPILKQHFKRDEFLGRINEILYFLPFNDKELKQLTIKQLDKWNLISQDKHDIRLDWDDAAVALLADGYNFRYGARSIQHEVEKRVINQIAKIHEKGTINNGSTVKIVGDTEKGTIKIEYDNSNMTTTKNVSGPNNNATDRTNKGNKTWFW
eukprot:79057_1